MATRVIDTLLTEYVFKTDTKNLDRLEARVDRTRRRLDGLSRTFAIAGAALTGALFGVGRTVLDFEQRMNNLQAVLNGSEEDMEALREQARLLGSELPVSTAEVVSAQTELAKAGLDVQEIMAALPGVLNLAIAGQIGLSEAAAIVTSTLAQFNLPASEAARVADVLAKAAISAKTDITEMGVAFRQAAPLAAQLGIPIEEVAALLAVLQDNGLKAETAGVGVRNMMTRLLNPTKEVRDALKTLGVDYDQVADLLNQGRLTDVLALLNKAGLDAATAAKLFGAETVSAAIIAAGATGDIDALEAALRNSEGTAKRMVDTQLQGLPGAWERLKSTFEDVQLALGDAGLTAGLERLLNVIRDGLTWFNELDEGVRKLVAGVLLGGPALVGLGAALKGASFALGGFTPLVRGATALYRLFWPEVAKGNRALRGTRGAAGTAARGFGLLRTAMLAVPALALIAGLTLLVTHWDEVSAAISRAMKWFADLLRDWGMPVDDIFAWITDAWQTVVDTVTAGVPAAWDWMMAIPNPFGWVDRAWGHMLSRLVGPLDGVWTWLTEQIENPFAWVVEQWNSLIETIANGPADIFAWIKDAWAGVMNSLIDLMPEWLRDFLGIEFVAPEAAPPVSADREAALFDNILAGANAQAASLGTTAPPGPVSNDNSRSVVFNGDIVVNAPSGDAHDIAEEVRRTVSNQYHDLVENFDSGIAR